MKKLLLSLLLAGVALNAADGAMLFKKCTACHGAHGEKHALGKSKIIAKLSPKEIEHALHGYKDGTFGGPMKGVMKGQVAPLDDAQITAIAEYIGAK